MARVGKDGFVAPAADKCEVCEKTVYPMEKLSADNRIFHKVPPLP